jgi:hypothetical protein
MLLSQQRRRSVTGFEEAGAAAASALPLRPSSATSAMSAGGMRVAALAKMAAKGLIPPTDKLASGCVQSSLCFHMPCLLHIAGRTSAGAPLAWKHCMPSLDAANLV